MILGKIFAANTQSERLRHALKILVEIEKQLRLSTDQNSNLMAALLEIISEDVCNRISTGIILPRGVNPFPGIIGNKGLGK